MSALAKLCLVGSFVAVALALWCTPSSPGQEAASKKGLAPEFEGIAAWVNSEPLKMQDLRGRVVVLHFYAFGCINCVRNLPHYNAWQKDLGDKKLTIIGLQTPETDDERKLERIREKAKDAGMAYPIAFDADSKMWKAWSNRLWPTVYLIDKQGYVRYRWEGELEWQGAGGAAKTRKKIEELLAEAD